MFNPSKPEPHLNNPTQRANELNDPKFEEQQGYFPYDLTHNEFLTTRYGEVTPTCNLHTIPGDRIVFNGNEKTVHTQIAGNFMGTVNEYSDSFFVPLRSLFPINYEKLIPNPTKGDDLPISALPKFPLAEFVYHYVDGKEEEEITISNDGDPQLSISVSELMRFNVGSSRYANSVAFTRWMALITMFSRGQLLDYLGYSFPVELQEIIEDIFSYLQEVSEDGTVNYFLPPDSLTLDDAFDIEIEATRPFTTLSEKRDAISYAFEHGYLIDVVGVMDSAYLSSDILERFLEFFNYLKVYLINNDNYYNAFGDIVQYLDNGTISVTDGYSYINLFSVLAYQQVIAQYYSNDSVDNIFNADLFMQNLRSVMFPASSNNFSSEPVFVYNGTETRYDLISLGSAVAAFLSTDKPQGYLGSQYLFITLMFILRNSLRYGDYFATARPNMLAVGDLSINVENGAVSPIDVTQNLLKQRYLNAANYIGSGFLPYMASIFGVTPSDTGTYPRFISHYKQTLRSDVVTNTAQNQGFQTTNLLGLSDGNSWDCFIDDYGVLLVLKSYDVLPVYCQGVERTFSFMDRFDLFNPMLQNMGDQPILGTELGGIRDYVFGYTMRNAEYKYKTSRAHGAFVTSLKGFYLPFPVDYYEDLNYRLKINPDFIRDRPFFFDSVVSQQTGFSPAMYYHFVVSCVNQLKTARKMQATPPVLF